MCHRHTLHKRTLSLTNTWLQWQIRELMVGDGPPLSPFCPFSSLLLPHIQLVGLGSTVSPPPCGPGQTQSPITLCIFSQKIAYGCNILPNSAIQYFQNVPDLQLLPNKAVCQWGMHATLHLSLHGRKSLEAERVPRLWS